MRISQVYQYDPLLIPIVYSTPSGTSVSGVGKNTGDDTWTAPSDPTMRWDDEDYVFQVTDELPVMRQSPDNGRHGFVLHDACWCLLQKAFEHDELPFERLLRVCQSLPFPLRGNGLCWGHDYGGVTSLDNQNHYPWEDRLIEHPNRTNVHQLAKENPYDIPKFAEILLTPPQSPPDLGPKGPGRDCFAIFPWEILDAIAINLPTGDALGLRLASKAFLPLFTSQTFWASRFEAGGDRGFFFFSRNGTAGRPETG